ncbi:MAG: hypothetical protein PHE67_00930 [Campylobacterales bacterium]|nr:hypothetical protein [Campylobacterales bacterium]
MRKILLLILTICAFGETIPTTSADKFLPPSIDRATLPKFNTCLDAASLTTAPSLINVALDENKNPNGKLDASRDIDISNGLIKYRVIKSGSSFSQKDIIEELTLPVEPCIKPSASSINAAVAENTKSIEQQVGELYNSLPEMEDKLKKEFKDKKNVSGQIGDVFTMFAGSDDENKSLQAFSNTNTNFGLSAKLPYFASFFQKIRGAYNEVLITIFLLYVLVWALPEVIKHTTYNNHGFLAVDKSAWWVTSGSYIGVGVVIFLFFWGGNPSQPSLAQGVWSMAVNESSRVASHITTIGQYEELRVGLKTGGFEAQKQKIKEATEQNLKFKAQAPALAKVLVGCSEQYYIDDLKTRQKEPTGFIFPTTYDEVGSTDEYDFNANFLKQTNTGAVEATPHYSLTTCAQSERAYVELAKQKNINDATIAAAKNVDIKPAVDNNEKLLRLSYEQGWTSVALLPASRAMSKGTSDIQKNIDKSAMDNVQLSGHQTGHSFDFKGLVAQMKNFDLQRTADALGGRMAFMAVPGAQGYYQSIRDNGKAVIDLMALPVELPILAGGKAAENAGVVGQVVSFGGVGTAAASSASAVALKTIDVGKNLAANFIAYYAATEIAKAAVENLVYLVIIGVAGLAIAFYFFEVLYYSLALPFGFIYAFQDNQRVKAIGFLIKGVKIATKPILLVISIMVAMYVADIFHSITFQLIEIQNNMLISQASSIYEKTEWSWSNPLAGLATLFASTIKNAIIHGSLLIIAALAEVYLISKIIISGPNVFWSYFDIQGGTEHLIESVGQQTQHLEKTI